jgi:hypothetical protein
VEKRIVKPKALAIVDSLSIAARFVRVARAPNAAGIALSVVARLCTEFCAVWIAKA